MKSTSFVVAAFFVGCTTGDDLHPPMLSSITPNHASPGVSVMLSGDYFCQQPDTGSEVDPLACANTGTVAFGSTPGMIGMWTEQLITAEVPGLAPAGYQVTVSVAGRTSNAVTFTVDP